MMTFKTLQECDNFSTRLARNLRKSVSTVMVVQTVTSAARRGESPVGAIESRWSALPTPWCSDTAARSDKARPRVGDQPDRAGHGRDAGDDATTGIDSQ